MTRPDSSAFRDLPGHRGTGAPSRARPFAPVRPDKSNECVIYEIECFNKPSWLRRLLERLVEERHPLRANELHRKKVETLPAALERDTFSTSTRRVAARSEQFRSRNARNVLTSVDRELPPGGKRKKKRILSEYDLSTLFRARLSLISGRKTRREGRGYK